MKPEKMMKEVVAGRLRGLRTMGLHQCADAMEAHIAALEAEREEWRSRALDNDLATQRTVSERDALRERVQALEKELVDAKRFHTAEYRVRQAAESRLAAIRQRADNRDALVRAYMAAPETESAISAVARYIMGEDSLPEPSTVEGVSNSGSNSAPKAPPEAFTHEKGLDAGAIEEAPRPVPPIHDALVMPSGAVLDVPQDFRINPEPTTTEAFATVRDAPGYSGDANTAFCKEEDARTALSLLERRMGAMARAIDEALPQCACVAFPPECEACATLRSSLTDAPTVFTLEEIDCALLEVVKDPAEIKAVRQHLTALRRTP